MNLLHQSVMPNNRWNENCVPVGNGSPKMLNNICQTVFERFALMHWKSVGHSHKMFFSWRNENFSNYLVSVNHLIEQIQNCSEIINFISHTKIRIWNRNEATWFGNRWIACPYEAHRRSFAASEIIWFSKFYQ